MSRYHFAYYAQVTGGFGFGNISWELDRPISHPADLAPVIAAIHRKNPENVGVTILSWQKFEEER